MSNFTANNNISLEEGIQAYEAKANQALSQLAAHGFSQPNPPTITTNVGTMQYSGGVPANLPELTDDQLGYYMGILTEWNNYVQYKLAEASVHYSKVKEIQEFIEAKLRIAYSRDDEDKKRSNPERDDYMKADRRYVEAVSSVIYWETMHSHTKAIANAAEQSFTAVSRRITQRGQEVDRGNRGNSVNNIPYGGGGPMFGRTRQ